MAKRIVDFTLALFGLIVFSPVLLPVMFLVWRQDRHSPFYIAPRVGKDGKEFRMVKLRSMVKNADKSGVDSTAAGDLRITGVGKFIRRYKLDELSQLWNVLIGDMSLVGPRPNVKRETDLYTAEERGLLAVKPGITDMSSIVFADEGDILSGKPDPDIAYNQLIRPWKSRLGLLYIENRSLILDLQLIFLTALTLVSRRKALDAVRTLTAKYSDDPKLIEICARETELYPFPPPGAQAPVMSREASAG